MRTAESKCEPNKKKTPDLSAELARMRRDIRRRTNRGREEEDDEEEAAAAKLQASRIALNVRKPGICIGNSINFAIASVRQRRRRVEAARDCKKRQKSTWADLSAASPMSSAGRSSRTKRLFSRESGTSDTV